MMTSSQMSTPDLTHLKFRAFQPQTISPLAGLISVHISYNTEERIFCQISTFSVRIVLESFFFLSVFSGLYRRVGHTKKPPYEISTDVSGSLMHQ